MNEEVLDGLQVRLVTKLTSAFLGVVLIVMSLHEYNRLRQEVEDFELDMDRTHLLVATTVAESIAALLARGSEDAAHEYVQALSRRHGTAVRVRWVCAGTEHSLPMSCDTLLTELARQTPFRHVVEDRRYMFATVR